MPESTLQTYLRTRRERRKKRRRLARRVATSAIERWIVEHAPRSRRWATGWMALGIAAYVVWEVQHQPEWSLLALLLLALGGCSYWDATLVAIVERLDGQSVDAEDLEDERPERIGKYGRTF